MKKQKSILTNTLLASMLPLAMMGGQDHSGLYNDPIEPKPSKPFVPSEMPKPRVKTEREIEKRKKHRQQLKARRNARKGIYEHKIVYKKKRSS